MRSGFRIAILLALAAVAQAQVSQSNSGALTAATDDCVTAPCVQIPVTTATGAVAFQLSGTFSATVSFEATVNGTVWVAWAVVPPGTAGVRVLTAAAPGIWHANVAGYKAVRARVSAFTSGEVDVIGNWSTAAAEFGVAP